MSNENEVGLDTGKQNDPKLKVEKKRGRTNFSF